MKRRRQRHTKKDRQGKTEVEIRVIVPQTKEPWEATRDERDKEVFTPKASGRSAVLPTP